MRTPAARRGRRRTGPTGATGWQRASVPGRVGAVAGLAALGLAWAGTATLAYATIIERQSYRLRRLDAAVLPPGSEPIRVLHLSDFHLLPWQRRKARWVAALARLEPDLIVDTGDNVGHAESLERLREMLEPFRGVPAVHVHGSNDYYGPVFKNPLSYLSSRFRVKKLAPQLDATEMDLMLERDLGWVPLDNAAADTVVRGTRIRWVGLADPHIKRDVIGDADASLAALDAAGPAPDVRLGMVHAPYRRAVDALVERGAALVFAGHTHGGQVCIPGRGAIISNCDLDPARAKGLSEWSIDAPEAGGPSEDELAALAARERGQGLEAEDESTDAGAVRAAGRRGLLHVSAGLGTSAYAPFRLACPPEATLVTLVPRA